MKKKICVFFLFSVLFSLESWGHEEAKQTEFEHIHEIDPYGPTVCPFGLLECPDCG
ncbi:hypothetical protein CP10139811_0357 [Chlamydia ibidis]|uniref:Uncharacterized protein n=2 Tax=Chlamydia ibidis TaxID=1405396 RepID=S7KDT0_9CHLA|nr:hypothetical protein [Chlamydia ibidis]EPP34351.1 hypothetical protein CP10139811_0357 [Chlamydia ibidis]EQM63025.1 hypothetical protein H359_0398 [Chlamydia ibidis 10-1398/6]